MDLSVHLLQMYILNICCYDDYITTDDLGSDPMRLSIEITPTEHQRLKAAAALQGQTLKDYVLQRTLPDLEEDAALKELEVFLKPRIERAKKKRVSAKSVDAIFDEVIDEENADP